MATKPAFHLPVFRSSFFEDRTHQAIDTFLASSHRHDGCKIIALRTDYQFHHRDACIVTADLRVDFIGEMDGRLTTVDPRKFDRALTAHFATLAAALCVDDIAIQNAGSTEIIPAPKDQGDTRILGRLFRHIQAQGFALFGREYPAGLAIEEAQYITGENKSFDERRAYMNLILPEAADLSAHDKIQEFGARSRIEETVRKIYDLEMDLQADELMPLAPIDFDSAVELGY